MDTSELIQLFKDRKYCLTTNEQWAAHLHYMLTRSSGLKRCVKELFVGFKPLDEWFLGEWRFSRVLGHKMPEGGITHETYCRKVATISREIADNGCHVEEGSVFLSRNTELFFAWIRYKRDHETARLPRDLSLLIREPLAYKIRILDTQQKLEDFFGEFPKSKKQAFCHLGELIERTLIYFAHDSWQERLCSARSCEMLKESLMADYLFVGSRTGCGIDQETCGR